MKLYYSPGSCALGIHVILEEVGKPYEVQPISFPNQEQYGDAYKAVNPKSKVPALERDDGSILTEFPAIATWLALTSPEKALLPTDPDGIARVLEAIDYVVATVHMQGFARIFRPGNFSFDEGHHEQSKSRGKEIVDKALDIIEKRFIGPDYLLGTYSIADAALFYVEFWAAKRMGLPLPARCQHHFETMMARPAVKAALAAEGLI